MLSFLSRHSDFIGLPVLSNAASVSLILEYLITYRFIF
jgi:hypothetical protein